jgi:hypothetical protein
MTNGFAPLLFQLTVVRFPIFRFTQREASDQSSSPSACWVLTAMVVANDKAPGPATSPQMLPTSFSIGMNRLKRLDDGSRHETSGLNDCSLVGVRVFRIPKDENARGQNLKYRFGACAIDRHTPRYCSQWIHFSTSKGVD